MKHNISKILVILAVTFLIIDIGLRYWYFKNFHLIFDSVIFNNVVTPIFTIISVLIYSFALFTALNQNKVILSQNIKPFYEKEIEKLLLEGKEIRFLSLVSEEEEKINAYNYLTFIHEKFVSLSRNDHYNEDYNDYKKGIIKDKNWFQKRSYRTELFFLNQFAFGISSVSYFYKKIIQLISEVNDSKLIEEDKILLKRHIFRTFLKEYMTFIETQLNYKNFMPPIPDEYGFPIKNIEFKQLAETKFGEIYWELKAEYEKTNS